MRYETLTLTLLLALSPATGQGADSRPELEVEGRIDEITIDPRGRLWVATAMGHVYRAVEPGGSWAEVEIGSRKLNMPETWFGDHLDRVSFFDERHAVISGYIENGQGTVFVTADGGATWTTAELPDSLWVYEAQTTDRGEAWLVGSSGSVLHTTDYGSSWEALPRPFAEPSDRTSGIWMAPSGRGVVTELGDALNVTTDGGQTWKSVETPRQSLAIESCEADYAQRVERPRFFDDKLVVLQCGTAYQRSESAWLALLPDRRVSIYEVAGDDLILMTEDLKVYRLGADSSLEYLGFELERPPVDLAVRGHIVAFIDATQKVTTYDGVDWVASRMLGRGVAESWPIARMDVGADGEIWGSSPFFLYRSLDAGKTWDRATEAPNMVSGLAIDATGDILLWDGHGWTARWADDRETLEPVPGLEGLDVVGSFRRPDVWLLFGGRQWETQGRIEVARTYFAGQFAGSVDFGWVAASTDGGRSWTQIDRWAESAPQEVFLSDDNRLTMISWLGGIRGCELSLEPLAASCRTILPATDETRNAVPYVEQAIVLDFLSDRAAWVLGWTHHVGESLFHSRDGGLTWRRARPAEHPLRGLYRLFDGRWLGFVLERELRLWDGERFQTFLELPAAPEQIFIASDGRLIVEVEGGNLWTLGSGTDRLERLVASP